MTETTTGTRVLVTGSTGFLGGQLCRALVEAGCSVRAFHRSTSSTRLLDGLEIEHVTGDLTRPETLPDALEGIQVVFHAAAQLGGKEEPGRMYAVTVEGTRALLSAARQAGVSRFVHTSSVAALGVPVQPAVRPAAVRQGKGGKPVQAEAPTVPNPDSPQPGLLIDENHTWNYQPQRWPYGYAKYLAELEVQKAVVEGLDAIIVNPSLVFGAGDIYRQQSSLVVRVANRKLPAVTEGGVNVVHVKDVVDGHLAAWQRGKCGQRYILGGQNMSIQALVNLIAQVAGVPAPEMFLPASIVRALTGPLRLLEPFISTLGNSSILQLAGNYFYNDTRKAQVELGLPPPRPAVEALREAHEWFKGVGSIR